MKSRIYNKSSKKFSLLILRLYMNIDESHGCKIDHGLFCVTGKDLDCIGIDDLY